MSCATQYVHLLKGVARGDGEPAPQPQKLFWGMVEMPFNVGLPYLVWFSIRLVHSSILNNI